ncbi:MAG: cyclodeaminase/cyclohydrolase family protein, partial [Deltaproteobacteria bacterium]|nr:cyclodeaminase/cyclohydrolase family protein [Deltaproteobacteria bacterium]
MALSLETFLTAVAERTPAPGGGAAAAAACALGAALAEMA